MEAPTVQLEKNEEVFSVFPTEMNAYFSAKEITIKVVPSDIDGRYESTCRPFRVSSADQYHAYLS